MIEFKCHKCDRVFYATGVEPGNLTVYQYKITVYYMCPHCKHVSIYDYIITRP